MAAPPELVLEDVIGPGERLVDVTPLVDLTPDDVRAVVLVQDRRRLQARLPRIDHRLQLFVLDENQFGGVLGGSPVSRHHRGEPFPGEADLVDGERVPLDVRKRELLRDRLHPGGEVRPGQHGHHARRPPGLGNVDPEESGVRDIGRDDGQMQHSGDLDVVDVPPPPADEASILEDRHRPAEISERRGIGVDRPFRRECWIGHVVSPRRSHG